MGNADPEERFARFDGRRGPEIVDEPNGRPAKPVKLPGGLLWLHGRDTGLLPVLSGRFHPGFGDRRVWAKRGAEHRPVAEEEAQVLLLDPASTVNTGSVRDGSTAILDGP